MISNRKVSDFEIEETLVCGLILIGREVKSVAKREADITGARVLSTPSPKLVGAFIKEQQDAYSVKYCPNRDRELLLKKSEIRYIQDRTRKGFWLIPMEIFQKNGKYKLKIGIGRPLKKWDKREKDKEKESKKQLNEL